MKKEINFHGTSEYLHQNDVGAEYLNLFRNTWTAGFLHHNDLGEGDQEEIEE